MPDGIPDTQSSSPSFDPLAEVQAGGPAGAIPFVYGHPDPDLLPVEKIIAATERALRARHGLWTIREVTITYENVQNVEVAQGPLMRLFGIWKLDIMTAGGARGAATEPGGFHASGRGAGLRGYTGRARRAGRRRARSGSLRAAG